ncbi:MAG: GtrA family protein [Eubacteriales bacterium]|nr:GtrA family protein [Eubacteriales bacterium]
METSKQKKSFVQLIKFALVGATNTIVDLVITRIVMAITGWDYVAKIIGFICGVVNSYILNSSWTFRAERKRSFSEMAKFLAVNVVVLGVSLGLKWLFQSVIGMDTWWMNTMGSNWFSNIINGEYFCTLCATVICIFVNFAGNKLFVFKSEKKTMEDVDAV